MPDAAAAPPVVVTDDDRTFAALSHALAIFAPIVAPLLIYLVKSRSRFVAFHALQSLYWSLLVYGIAFTFGVFVFVSVALGSLAFGSGSFRFGEPFGVFVPAFAVFALAGTGLNLLLHLVLCVRASEGRWTRYPLAGALAGRTVGPAPA